MDAEKYNRTVTLQCPSCGGTGFKYDQSQSGGVELATCAQCGRTLTKDELIRENGENIAANVDEVKKAIVDDVRDQLKRAFAGNKHFKIK